MFFGTQCSCLSVHITSGTQQIETHLSEIDNRWMACLFVARTYCRYAILSQG